MSLRSDHNERRRVWYQRSARVEITQPQTSDRAGKKRGSRWIYYSSETRFQTRRVSYVGQDAVGFSWHAAVTVAAGIMKPVLQRSGPPTHTHIDCIIFTASGAGSQLGGVSDVVRAQINTVLYLTENLHSGEGDRDPGCTFYEKLHQTDWDQLQTNHLHRFLKMLLKLRHKHMLTRCFRHLSPLNLGNHPNRCFNTDSPSMCYEQIAK